MIFSSDLFLLYFLPLTLTGYYLTPKKFRNYTALLASIIFYSWIEPKFVFIVIASAIVNYYIINNIRHSDDRRTKRFLLLITIIVNLSILLYFKYANFFIENVNVLFHSMGVGQTKWVNIIMPLGISFYTFQSLSYSIDVYRKVAKPLHNFFDYLLYIMLFPKMLAGPIVKYNNIANQFNDRSASDTIDDKLLGFYRFVIGLAKKVLIADIIGVEADRIFALPHEQLTTPLAWLGATAYSFQIYFDFAGYSDMAIGIGRMLGFRITENFNSPYISRNITEFWRRWHITLSTWFRDYLFLPIAYSVSRKWKKNKYMLVKTEKWIYILATTITFLLCGFWHGAAWTFIIWGAFHGLFLILDRIFLLKLTKKAGKLPGIILTYIIVLVGWVIFRAEKMSIAKMYIRKMFTFDFGKTELYFNAEFWTVLIIAAVFSFIAAFKHGERLQKAIFENKYNMAGIIVMTIITIVLLIVSISFITSSDFKPFVYLRF